MRFLPYQKRERLPLSLSSADIHVVGLAKGLAGYVVPSRAVRDPRGGSPRARRRRRLERDGAARARRRLRDRHPARPARTSLARTIREAADGAFDLGEMGRRGRAYVEEEADRVVAMERYRALVRELLAA